MFATCGGMLAAFAGVSISLRGAILSRRLAVAPVRMRPAQDCASRWGRWCAGRSRPSPCWLFRAPRSWGSSVSSSPCCWPSVAAGQRSARGPPSARLDQQRALLHLAVIKLDPPPTGRERSRSRRPAPPRFSAARGGGRRRATCSADSTTPPHDPPRARHLGDGGWHAERARRHWVPPSQVGELARLPDVPASGSTAVASSTMVRAGCGCWRRRPRRPIRFHPASCWMGIWRWQPHGCVTGGGRLSRRVSRANITCTSANRSCFRPRGQSFCAWRPRAPTSAGRPARS